MSADLIARARSVAEIYATCGKPDPDDDHDQQAAAQNLAFNAKLITDLADALEAALGLATGQGAAS